jgi:hypothetical protein
MDSSQNVSPLRLRMIEDMRMRKLAPKTQAARSLRPPTASSRTVSSRDVHATAFHPAVAWMRLP